MRCYPHTSHTSPTSPNYRQLSLTSHPCLSSYRPHLSNLTPSLSTQHFPTMSGLGSSHTTTHLGETPPCASFSPSFPRSSLPFSTLGVLYVSSRYAMPCHAHTHAHEYAAPRTAESASCKMQVAGQGAWATISGCFLTAPKERRAETLVWFVGYQRMTQTTWSRNSKSHLHGTVASIFMIIAVV